MIPKPTKQKSKGKLVQELDKVYSLYIRRKYASENDLVECVSCNLSYDIKAIQNGHYISRARYATRWLDKNCHPQCMRCNVFLNGNYPAYTRFMIRTYGPEVIDELLELSQEIPKLTRGELEFLIAKYKMLVYIKDK